MIVCPHGCLGTPDIILEKPEKTLCKCSRCNKFFEIFPRSEARESTEPPIPLKISTRRERNINENSIEAYRNLTPGSQRKKVADYIKTHSGSCIREIAEALAIEKSSVSPRLTELKAEGIVLFEGKKEFKGNTVDCWSIK